MSTLARRIVFGLSVCLGALGCDEKPQHSAAQAASAAAPLTPTATSEAAKPSGPPTFEIDTLSAKVGFDRALLDKRDGQDNLTKLLKPSEHFVDGQDVNLIVDRNAKLPWVVTYIDELGKLGAKHVVVKTETRKEYPTSLAFTPELSLKNPPDCSTVAMVRDDRATAVWKLSGGVATQHSHGMAGPDLSMTGGVIERFAKACKRSTSLFVSAGKTVEWGLTYDLAASAETLNDVKFDTVVLLGEQPVPGRKVVLRH